MTKTARQAIGVFAFAALTAAGVVGAPAMADDEEPKEHDVLCVATADPISNGICISERDITPSTYLRELPGLPTAP